MIFRAGRAIDTCFELRLVGRRVINSRKSFAAWLVAAGLLGLISTWHQYALGSPDSKEAKTIVFLGDSLTAGFGLDIAQAFPSLIQTNVDLLHLPYQVINAGLSGDTSAGGLRRIDWLLRRPINVLVIALGGNDGLRGIPPELTRANLQGIIGKAKSRYPGLVVVVAGMRMPPNLGEAYTREFEGLFADVAKKNRAELVPFLLAGVGGVPELNQADQIHPTAEGHRKVAATVWEVLRPVLQNENTPH